KSAAAPRPLDPMALACDGLVDRAFPRLFAAGPVTLDWIGPGEAARLRQLLAGAAYGRAMATIPYAGTRSRLGWAVTGSGHFFDESLALIERLADVDL